MCRPECSFLLTLSLLTGLFGCGGGDDSATSDTNETTTTTTTTGPLETEGDDDGAPGDGDGDGAPGDGDGDGDGDCEPGDGVCGACEAHPPIGQLCVRGEFVDGQELLQADGPVRFQLFPDGCYSSGCTIPTTSTCEVVDDTTPDIVLSGTFCLATEGDCSLPDCSGGGWSECELASVPAGDYTVTIDDLQLAFSVPSVLDGSNCIGDPFD